MVLVELSEKILAVEVAPVFSTSPLIVSSKLSRSSAVEDQVILMEVVAMRQEVLESELLHSLMVRVTSGGVVSWACGAGVEPPAPAKGRSGEVSLGLGEGGGGNGCGRGLASSSSEAKPRGATGSIVLDWSSASACGGGSTSIVSTEVSTPLGGETSMVLLFEPVENPDKIFAA